MLRLIFLFLPLSLVSCSLGVVEKGGERAYTYETPAEYSSDQLKTMTPGMVKTSTRDPQVGKLNDLFSKHMPPLKKIGIIVFETMPQATRSGLSGADKVYVSAAGKQILTEQLLSIWEESFPILAPEVSFVSREKFVTSEKMKLHGAEVTDHVNSKRSALAPDDIFFLPPGKNTALPTILNPRGMRDFSLLLVPASELMAGPKFSEHHKHAVNEVAKELGLDTVLVIMSEMSWTAGHTDKHSGEYIPEEMKVKINATNLVSFTAYHARLKKLRIKTEYPKTSVPFRTYEIGVKIPINVSVAESEQDFETVEKEVISPLLKTYKDLAQMIIYQIGKDMGETH